MSFTIERHEVFLGLLIHHCLVNSPGLSAEGTGGVEEMGKLIASLGYWRSVISFWAAFTIR